MEQRRGQTKLRSLDNYKSMHDSTAKNKDVYESFMRARTLTEARKILFGTKKGQRPIKSGGNTNAV
jgi:hypothetical protein